MSDIAGVSGDILKSFINRIELLEQDNSNVMADIAEVMAEAKSAGFDIKTIRKIISIRKMDDATREEQEEVLNIYLSALGMNK